MQRHSWQGHRGVLSILLHTLHTSYAWRRQGGHHAYLSLSAHWWQLQEVDTVDCISTAVAGSEWALFNSQIAGTLHTSASIWSLLWMTEGW